MFEWFSTNDRKAKASTYHLFISSYEFVPVNVRSSITESSKSEKLLGVHIYIVTFHSNII